MPAMEGYLGLGSNLGDRAARLREGLAGLERRDVRILGVSSVYETSPIGCSEPNPFLNMVARVGFEGGPGELLKVALEVERESGRVRTGGNRPRPLDIDLLWFPGVTRSGAPPILPHPRMWNRRFVLVPLAELAPDLINPASGKTVTEEMEGLMEGEVHLYNPGLRSEEFPGG